MAKKSGEKKARPKTKISPKVGVSKKVKTKKASKEKKLAAKAKAKNPANQLKKAAIAEQRAKAKKHRHEVKKPKTSLKIKTKKLLKAKEESIPSMEEINKHIQAILEQRKNEGHNNNEFLHPDPAHANGKKHLNLQGGDGAHMDYIAKRNGNIKRPEAYSKRGRSTASRATLPTN